MVGKTHLEDFVMWEERKLQEREADEPGSNALVRKVTLRIGLSHHVALRLLARRYGYSPTRLAQEVLESAIFDACDMVGITGEEIMEQSNEEAKAAFEALQAPDGAPLRNLSDALAEHEMFLGKTDPSDPYELALEASQS